MLKSNRNGGQKTTGKLFRPMRHEEGTNGGIPTFLKETGKL